MTKSDLVGKMAEAAAISKAAAEKAFAGALDAIEQALRSGEKVSLIGFGTFSVTQRDARQGRNPATGKTIQIPAKKVVKFKPGAALANKVNK
jgi:DNA-binding protein HU-beta